jgi:dihydrofolate reductase
MSIPQPEIAIIVAIGKSRELGKDNRLLWRIKEDLQRFKQLSLGHPLIMGRKTFESIGRPLPGRTNIVITRNPTWSAEGVTVMHSFKEALEHAKTLDPEMVVIGGGTEIYVQALPYTTRLYLTLIDDSKEADSYFPAYETEFTKKVFEEKHTTPEGLSYAWVDLER